jgi:putative transcriptional regulator
MTTAGAYPDLLAAYAAGSLSEGLRLLVASHIALNSASRTKVAQLEAIGGALLRDAAMVEPGEGCLEAALSRIDGPEGRVSSTCDVPPDDVLPAPLRRALGLGSADIRWRFLLPGLSEHRLEGYAGEEVSLLRAKPGVRILQHTHAGDEATLVLSGRLKDGGAVFARGDVSLADHTDDHHPEVVGSEVCVCLVVLSGAMRFTGPVGRALNILRS